MVRKHEQQSVETRPGMYGGRGEATLRSLLDGPGEMNGKGRLFKHITVPVGASIGYHLHTGESETYYILAGSGLFDDNGSAVPFAAGDVLLTPDGNGHSLENTGDVPVELVALILNA